MAGKVKMLTLLQEIRGFARIANRCPPPRTPGLVLAQMRMSGKQDSLRKRKLSINFNQQTQPDMPHQVKINHLKPATEPAAQVRAQ
jgi:hypothetical protein